MNINRKKILEIGSSSGYFLDALSSAGTQVIGVELTKSYASYSKKLGFTVYSDPLETIGFENEFDLVVMFHTLEHVFDPMTICTCIYKSLRKTGVFMGEIPNQNDWRLKIFDNDIVKRFHYDPNHYFYFSPATLTNYLKRCKFKKVMLETSERYNSLIQLKRILRDEYNQNNVDKILKRDIFAKPKQNVRIPHPDDYQETEFNRIFEKGVNSELLGNCLRWMATKE